MTPQNILELTKARWQTIWCRPTNWVGEALCWSPHNHWQRVPTSHGGEPARLSPDEFLAQWETVRPEQVLAESEQLKSEEKNE